MIVQRTLLGPGRKWVGPWRIRVNTEASGTSKLIVTGCMYGGSKKAVLTDWGDGTQSITVGMYGRHTYAESGDYIISHYARDKYIPDMTATTQRIIHVPAGCTTKSSYPTKYTIVADR